MAVVSNGKSAVSLFSVKRVERVLSPPEGLGTGPTRLLQEDICLQDASRRYQLDFTTPGMCPCRASLRKQMRQRPNRRM